MRILLLEDDPLQLELAHSWLESVGHQVFASSVGDEAIRLMQRDAFDLAVLDWMVPDVSGEQVLTWIRKRGIQTPVIFATARDAEHEIAAMLRLGADDYIVKPLRRLEFVARVEAVGRRAGVLEAEVEPLAVGPYRIDPTLRAIYLNDRPIKMTPRMMDVALVLFRRHGELVSRARLYEQVWGHRADLDTRSVDTHISRLRMALELDGRHGYRLASVYQQGYRLEQTDPRESVH